MSGLQPLLSQAAFSQNASQDVLEYTAASHASHTPRDQHASMSWQGRRLAAAKNSSTSMTQYFARVVCSAHTTSKQICLFSNVCLIPTANSNADQPPYLTVVLPRPTNISNNKSGVNHAAVDQLKTHLNGVLAVQTREPSTSQSPIMCLAVPLNARCQVQLPSLAVETAMSVELKWHQDRQR